MVTPSEAYTNDVLATLQEQQRVIGAKIDSIQEYQRNKAKYLSTAKTALLATIKAPVGIQEVDTVLSAYKGNDSPAPEVAEK